MSNQTSTYVAPARPGPGAPVLLLHPWWGLNQPIKDLADRLSGDGFTVVAPDLFDGTVLTTIDEAEAHTGEIDRERTLGRIGAALDDLLARPDARGEHAAIIGLSLGAAYGTLVAEARPEVTALVCIYSGIFEAPEGVAYLGHFAENDQFDDSSQVAGLQAALGDRGVTHIYPGTRHWFVETDRPEYDAEAAELVYTRTVEFLRRHLA
jgi:carboxymethylenebutenolidase